MFLAFALASTLLGASAAHAQAFLLDSTGAYRPIGGSNGLAQLGPDGHLPSSLLPANSLQYTNSLSGPAWGNFTGNWQGVTVNIGSYPAASLFGSGTVPIAEGLVGEMNIPASSTAYNHGAGVSGYGRTASPTQGGVGLFGWGMMAADNVQAWGANVGVTNCKTPNCIGSAGYSGATLYGLEIDVNLAPVAGGGNPLGGARGLYLVGGSSVHGQSTLTGLDVDSPGIGMTPHLHWDYALHSDDGAAAVALGVGALDERDGRSSGSQAIQFTSRNPQNTVQTSVVSADQDGNLVVVPANKLVVKGSLAVNQHTPASSSESCTPGQTTNNATYYYWCASPNHWVRVRGNNF